MNEDSIKLLKEVNAGCKMATDSMEQLMDFAKDKNLKQLIEIYDEEHIKIGDQCHQLLNQYGKNEKDPPQMAKAFSWISTEMKMMMNKDTCKIANILVDGCNMGVKSLSKYIHQYKNADQNIASLAQKLVRIEKDFADKLLAYV
ncbi:MAG: hypothetical protein PHH48_03805 [Eubacteriales bacterium]|jgi:hypothetical protein|nr:hypothetical protein [Eubacteriales bacterium]